MQIERIVVVTKRTTLEELVVRFQTRDQAKFYLTQAGEDFSAIERQHEIYHQALNHVRRALPPELKQHVIERSVLPQYRFQATDLVITLGPDGLVVNTAKYLDTQWILPLNPDPATIDGILCPVPAEAVSAVLRRTLKERADIKAVTMAEARLSDGQSLLAVNDLFVGARTHVSARYRIQHGKQAENQSSSGIIISTGVGSTGWMKSVLTGSVAVASTLGATAKAAVGARAWDADQLMFAVREPFPSKATSASIVFGPIDRKATFELTSMMPGNGVIFSDGVEADFLEFNSGAHATIGIAARKAMLAL